MPEIIHLQAGLKKNVFHIFSSRIIFEERLSKLYKFQSFITFFLLLYEFLTHYLLFYINRPMRQSD
jgi:hypothetical protein